MPKLIEADGKKFEFPDEATDDQINSSLMAQRGASWWETVKAIPGNVLGGAQKGIGGQIQAIGESNAGAAYAAERAGLPYDASPQAAETAPHIQYIAKKTGQKPEDIVAELQKGRETNPVAQAGAGVYESGKLTEEAAAPPGQLSFWKRALLSGASSTAQLAPLIAGGIATKSAAPIVAGAATLQAGQTYGEAREKGLPPDRAAAHATIDAAAEGLLEMIPGEFLVENAAKGVGRLIAGTLVREVPTEVATTAIQSANAKISTQPDMTWEDYFQSLLDTVGSTMIAAPLTGGAAKALSVLDRSHPAVTPAATPPATQNGADNSQLIAPNFDQPTIPIDSKNTADIDQLIASIDADMIDDKQVTEAKATLAQHEEKKAVVPAPQAEGAWSALHLAPTSPVEDVGELGASAKQAANAPNYLNPNTGDRLDRQFLYGPSGAEGKTPRQIVPVAGTYTLGQASDDRSPEYLRAVHDTVEQWRQEYMPESTFVVSNEQLFTNSALGQYYSMTPTMHMIVPAVLRSPKKGLGAFNVNTQASAFYNLTHEFGHALVYGKFFEGVAPQTALQLRSETTTGLASEASINAMPAPQQAVLREYNLVKQQVLNGQMKAQDFVDTWLNPAKVGRATFLKDLNVAPTDTAQSVVKALVRRAVKNSNIATEVSKNTLSKKLQADYLSLDEYVAEQTARYAFAKQKDKTSPLGQFFSRALQGLRNFFIDRKKDGTLAPGTEFQNWLDGISKSTRAINEPALIAEGAKKAGKGVKEKVVAAKKKAKTVKPKKIVETVQHNVETSTVQEKAANARKMVTNLVRSGALKASDPEFKGLLKLINQEDFDEFIDDFQRIAGKSVKFELDDTMPAEVKRSVTNLSVLEPSNAEAAREWKEKQFKSTYFKAWFGDWENEPDTASKVVKPDGVPLVVYNATRGAIEGNAGFHFGTVRAAYTEGKEGSFAPTEGLSVIPAVLNIRKPLDLGPVNHSVWDSAEKMLTVLQAQGYITKEEQVAGLQEISAAGASDVYASFAPVRDVLKGKGFDGITYANYFEGDTSFVAFDMDQVKSVVGAKNVHMELDYDAKTPEGFGAGKILNAVKNFLSDPGPLRRALRKVQHLGYHVFQLQQLAHLNPDIEELAYMNLKNGEYNRYKAQIQSNSDRVLGVWDDLGEDNFNKVNKFLQDEAEGGKHWGDLVKDGTTWKLVPNAETVVRMTEHGIDPASADGEALGAHIFSVKNDLLNHVNQTEKALIAALRLRYAGASMDVLKAALIPVLKKVHEIRKAPFFPQGRFGNLMITVEQKRLTEPGHEVVYREAFESRGDWEKAWATATAKAQAGEIVRKHELSDTQYVLMALPTEFADIAASELGLSPAQREQLASILQPVKSEKAFRSYDQSRLGIKGYSADAMRSYANFTWHNANMLAKLMYRADFNLAIRGVEAKRNAAAVSKDPVSLKEFDRLTQVVDSMKRTRDFIMAPPNEMHLLRSFVAVSYLALNVKTAALNLYGLVTTWSAITSRFGPVKGTAILMRAFKDSAASVKLTDLNDRRPGFYLTPEKQEAMDRALEEGVLSQSYAYHLAGMANASNLYRLPGRRAISQTSQKLIDLSMWAFRLTELATRRVSFLSVFEGARSEGKNTEDAYQEAVSRTALLQNDYSLGNRVPFMRKPLVAMATIFASFTQHAAFHTLGGYELGERRAARELGQTPRSIIGGYTMKILLVTLLLGGYEALPGMENLLDLLSIAWRKFGGKKPLRQEMREMVQEVGGDPIMLARGLGHNIAGFDVSRSLGFGRIVPGTDTLANADQDVLKTVGTLTLDAAGPAGGFIKFGLESTFGKQPLSQSMQHLPGGLGNIYTAYKWSKEGVRTPQGSLVTHDLETGELRDLTKGEIFGKALGFNPTIVSQNREIRHDQYEQKVYWQSRRQGLLDDAWRASWQKDKNAQADVKKAIAEYNASVPDDYKDLRVTMAEVARSRMANEKKRRLDEQGVPAQRKFRSLYKGVAESYE